MVAAPNQGLSLTYFAASASKGWSREEIDQLLANTVVGWLLPRTDMYQALYDGSKNGDLCVHPEPLIPPLDDVGLSFKKFDVSPPDGVEYINIYAKTKGKKGLWDLAATRNSSGDWYGFRKRPVTKVDDKCGKPILPTIICDGIPSNPITWEDLQWGDGTVPLGNACLPASMGQNIYVEVDAKYPHIQLLSAPEIREQIRKALGLLE